MDQEDSDLVSVSEFSQEDDQSSNHDENIDLGKKKKKSEYIGQKETQGVFRAKMMVYLVLIISCAAASTLTFLFTSDQENKDFDNDVGASRESFVLFFNRIRGPTMHPLLFSVVFSLKRLLTRFSGRQRQICCRSLMSRRV